MILDLDRFKAVNDTLGHPVGDKLLAQVAARLRSIMERGMTCGRLGGDEFAIVLPNVPGAKEAEDLAHRIIATPSRPYVVANRSEERRVGKECVRTCRSRGSPYH